jgi:hypothetical protein
MLREQAKFRHRLDAGQPARCGRSRNRPRYAARLGSKLQFSRR